MNSECQTTGSLPGWTPKTTQRVETSCRVLTVACTPMRSDEGEGTLYLSSKRTQLRNKVQEAGLGNREHPKRGALVRSEPHKRSTDADYPETALPLPRGTEGGFGKLWWTPNGLKRCRSFRWLVTTKDKPAQSAQRRRNKNGQTDREAS